MPKKNTKDYNKILQDYIKKERKLNTKDINFRVLDSSVFEDIDNKVKTFVGYPLLHEFPWFLKEEAGDAVSQEASRYCSSLEVAGYVAWKLTQSLKEDLYEKQKTRIKNVQEYIHQYIKEEINRRRAFKLIEKQINPLGKDESLEVGKKLNQIFQKIEKVADKIDSAKELSTRAKYMDEGKWYNKNKKSRERITTNSEAIGKTNEAISEMNDLIQEAIYFTCISLQVSFYISKNIIEMMENGFKGSDGELMKLNETGAIFVKKLLKLTSDFVITESKRKKELGEISSKSDDNDKRHDEEIKVLKQRIENFETLMSNNNEKYDEEIKALKKRIKNLENTNIKPRSTTSVFALVFSLISIILSVAFKFYL